VLRHTLDSHSTAPPPALSQLRHSLLTRDRRAAPLPAWACAQRGTTPLHLAAEQGHASVVVLLLSHGADVNANDVTVRALVAHRTRPRAASPLTYC
jgi:hypothetical protein